LVRRPIGKPSRISANSAARRAESGFAITGGDGSYNNGYQTPGSYGVWDFSRSFVTNVPEPGTWGLLLIGLAGLGGNFA